MGVWWVHILQLIIHFCRAQGLYIRFRDLSGGSQKYNIMTVMSPTSQTHIVGNLKKHTKYEFFIAPFYRSVEGQPSNSKIVQTFEDGKKCAIDWLFYSIDH